MNYHEDNNEKKGSHKKNSLKHILHMGLCCGLPILLVAFIPLITRYNPALGGKLWLIVPFLCPILMIFMMPMMHKGDKKGSCCDDKNEKLGSNKPLELNKSIE